MSMQKVIIPRETERACKEIRVRKETKQIIE